MKIWQTGEPPKRPHASRKGKDGMMSDRELTFIEALAEQAPLKHFLEVGVFKGTSTTMLAQIGTVVGVDWFKGIEQEGDCDEMLNEFLATLEEMKVQDKVTILTGKSDDVLPILKNDKFGLVLLDASHKGEAPYLDIKNTWDLIVPGGWLLLDDWTTEGDIHVSWERFAEERGLKLELNALTETQPKLVAVQKPLVG